MDQINGLVDHMPNALFETVDPTDVMGGLLHNTSSSLPETVIPDDETMSKYMDHQCLHYASAMDRIERADDESFAKLNARYTDRETGVFHPESRKEALAKFDDIIRISDRARHTEWVTSGRACIEDIAHAMCEIPGDAFTPEVKQLFELIARAYNLMTRGSVRRLAEMHDILVMKVNQCVLRRGGISEITFRMLDMLNAEVHRTVHTSRCSSTRLMSAAIIALIVGVFLGYGIRQVRN